MSNESLTVNLVPKLPAFVVVLTLHDRLLTSRGPLHTPGCFSDRCRCTIPATAPVTTGGALEAEGGRCRRRPPARPADRRPDPRLGCHAVAAMCVDRFVLLSVA